MLVNKPYENDYCYKCMYHYLLDRDESRCRINKIGLSDAMCAQMISCVAYSAKEQKRRK